MAVTDLGNTRSQGGGVTTAVMTVTNTVSAGVLVVVFVSETNATTPGHVVTDSKGNTYTLGPSIISAFSSYIFYSFITTPLAVSDTITFTDSAATGFQVYDISAVSVPGYGTYTSATANANNNGFASSFSVTGAGSAAVANEIYFGFSSTNDTFSGTPSGWTTSPPSTPAVGNFLAGWNINAGTTALTWNGTTTGAQNTTALIVSFQPTAATVVRGFDYIQDDIYPKNKRSVITSMPPAYGRTPFAVTNTNVGIPWSGPRDHVRLPIPTANISSSPAFVSTFRTAPISGMAWREPVDEIRIPPRVSYSVQPAFVQKAAPVPISGMAWFEPPDKDYPARVNFLTYPVAVTYAPQTVTWSFLVGDTTFLRDAPVDTPPAFGRSFAAPVGISGMAWFEPPDRDRPATKVSIETPPAAFGRAIAQPVPISGMAWFTPLDWSKAKVSFDGPSSFDPRPPVGVSISGISWFEPPDRDKPANKVRIEAPPSIALTPATLPVPIRGMAWFEPPDRDRSATKFKLDNPPAWIYFLQSVITGTLVATESPDTVTITMTYRDLWVAATKETELWTPAIKQAETWTPE